MDRMANEKADAWSEREDGVIVGCYMVETGWLFGDVGVLWLEYRERERER